MAGWLAGHDPTNSGWKPNIIAGGRSFPSLGALINQYSLPAVDGYRLRGMSNDPWLWCVVVGLLIILLPLPSSPPTSSYYLYHQERNDQRLQNKKEERVVET